MQIYNSNGWKSPYCYTIIDMHKVLKGPINDPEGIMDGGYYIYGAGLDKQKHIEWLLKSNFKFIMGFDFCEKEERKRLIELMLKHGKNVYPILKSKEDWQWYLDNDWKVNGIASANDYVIDKAFKKG